MQKNKVLILSDGKLGHQNQSVRLAEKLGIKYDILKLERRVCGKALSFVCSKYIVQNMSDLKKQLLNNSYSVVIGIGTVPRLAMLWVKEKYPELKTICIMDPKSNHDKYDLILMPNHDNSPYKGDNVINITGGLSYFNQSQLEEAKEQFSEEFDFIKDNGCVGLVIGGDSNAYRFDREKSQDIVSKTFLIAKKLGAGVYATTSRRTPSSELVYIKNIVLKSKNRIFTGLGVNPYRAILGYSSIIVVTPETVSMLMEACATKSLVLIANKDSVKSKRIQSFINELIEMKMAYELDRVSSYNKEELDEMIKEAQNKQDFKDLDNAVAYINSKNWI